MEVIGEKALKMFNLKKWIELKENQLAGAYLKGFVEDLLSSNERLSRRGKKVACSIEEWNEAQTCGWWSIEYFNAVVDQYILDQMYKISKRVEKKIKKENTDTEYDRILQQYEDEQLDYQYRMINPDWAFLEEF